MKETSKAMKRRMKDATLPWKKIFHGNGLDVGSGDDPLHGAKPFDLPDGGGDDLRNFFPGARFDYIHGSQVLEHAISPELMLTSWIGCLKPRGGYIVATVPDWELYEGKVWPSRTNLGHRTTWSMTDPNVHCKLPEWLAQFELYILRCKLIDTNYDYNQPGPSFDQTYDPDAGVEAFIEFVLRT